MKIQSARASRAAQPRRPAHGQAYQLSDSRTHGRIVKELVQSRRRGREQLFDEIVVDFIGGKIAI